MRRLRRLLLILSYLMITAVIVVTTVILVAVGQGYSYNFRTHHFSLQGLLEIISVPSGGAVKLNGKDIRHKTPYRVNVEAGSYTVEVNKPGYRKWQKRLEVKVSEVTFASYILLLPTDIKSSSVISGGVGQLVSTKDGRHLAYITGGSDPGIWLLNPDRRQGTKIYTPRSATPDAPAETLVSATWSDDGSHLLARTTVGPTPNYILISAAGNTAPENLTEIFRFDFNGLQFNPNNWRELYWISPEGLRRVDAEARNVSAVLAEKVSAYTFAGDRLLYIQSTSLGKTVWSVDRSGRDAKRLLESLAESDNYEMLYRSTLGKDWLAILPAQSNTATIYQDIFSANPEAKVVSKSASHIGFNDNGQFLAFYSPTSFGSYDLEKNKVVSVTTDGLSSLGWYDSSHLLLSKKSRLYMSEFDGANMTEIAQTASPALSFPTPDGRQVLFLRPSAIPNSEMEIASAEIKK